MTRAATLNTSATKRIVRRYKVLTPAAERVLRAALALRDEKGWCFRYSRDDVKYQVVDILKMKRLEKALQEYKPLKGNWL